MSKRQYGLMLMVALIAGLTGGVVSSQLKFDSHLGKPYRPENLTDEDISTLEKKLGKQGKPPMQYRLLVAEELWLVNEKGQVRIKLKTDDHGSSLTLRDSSGRDRTTLGRTDLKVKSTGEIRKRPTSSLVFFNEEDRVIWHAPTELSGTHHRGY